MDRPKEIPSEVLNGISKAFPGQSDEILGKLQWDALNGCYFVDHWGMYIGIELDGYVHS